MAAYEVTGPAVLVPDRACKLHYYYTGAVLPDGIPADQLERLAGRGLISKVDPVPASSVEFSEDSTPLERPSQVATKPLWVDYAVSRGMSREEAEALTKPELIDRFPPE